MNERIGCCHFFRSRFNATPCGSEAPDLTDSGESPSLWLLLWPRNLRAQDNGRSYSDDNPGADAETSNDSEADASETEVTDESTGEKPARSESDSDDESVLIECYLPTSFAAWWQNASSEPSLKHLH